MTTSPTSYLQTLPKDEAIAFVASLQKVKIHLSQELAWMSQQVQQKNVQLQGIETLLSEVAATGQVNAATGAGVEPTATVKPTAATPATVATNADSTTDGSSLTALPVVAAPAIEPASNGDAAPATPKPAIASDVAPPPPKAAAKGTRGAQPATKKTSATPALKAKPTAYNKAKPTVYNKTSHSKASPPAKESTQPFVKSQFQEQSITDAIGGILKQSRSPLSADEIMAMLYEGLSDEAYKRAKNSVTNILSVGRVKGKWKSTARGLYADNAVS